jgi:hypothetical protein
MLARTVSVKLFARMGLRLSLRVQRCFELARTLACVAWLALASLAAAQEERTNRADYRIHARLDGATKRLTGSLGLRWTNRSGEAVRDLWFHLYLNAFSNNRSTHLLESEGKLRGKEITAGWGWSQVRAIRVDGAANGGFHDVLSSMRYERPDDGNEEDRTVFRVDLPQPVASGETVNVQIEWESQLPRVRRRTGYKDDFLLVAQWFPKLGVYEAGRGWNCHQFHMNTEFFSDYGTYDVTLDLPIDYAGKIGASGVKLNDTPKGDRVEVRFVAPSLVDERREDAFGKRPLVHDFTWTADTRYVSPPMRQTFRFKEWAERFPVEVEKARAIFGEEPKLRDVDVTVLIHPEHASQAKRHFEATCAALFFYGLWFGEYPYEHVTVVDPAWGAAAGGMEYPTLFTAGSRLFTTEDMHQPEGVTVHECGHQFWYGLVGNNEFEAAWLDEGFNTYTDSEVLKRVYGDDRSTTDYARFPVDGVAVAELRGGGALGDALAARELTVPLPFLPDPKLRLLAPSGLLDYWRDQPLFTFAPEWTDPRWADRCAYLRDPDTDPIETPGWKYADRESYATNSYPRTGVALRTLQGLIGDEAFYRGMRRYARDWRYLHPYPDDFFRAFQAGAGLELDWFFEEFFRGTGTVDWSVSVEQARRDEPRGFFQGEGGEFLERAAPEKKEGEEESAQKAPYHVEVELRRKGTLTLPLPVRLTFEDGTRQELTWSREEQQKATWKRITLDSEKKLSSVVLDPERRFYVDRDLSNNAWHDATDRVAPWRWSERVLAQFQNYLHFLQGLGG